MHFGSARHGAKGYHLSCRRAALRQIGAQDVGGDFALLAGDGHIFRNILELSHIAGPVVGEEHSGGLGIQSDGRHLVLFAHLEGELFEEQDGILSAFAQGGNLDGHGVESVVEVLSETSFGDGLVHVDVGRCYDAHVRTFDLAGTYGDKLARFKHAQEAGLGGQG